MPIQAVIFDRDGVLTYFDVAGAARYLQQTPPLTPYDLVAVWDEYGGEQGFPVSLAMEQRFFAGFWARVCARYAIAPAQQHLLYAMDYTRYVRAFPDAPDVLAQLHDAGLRIGVLSNFALASLDDSLAAAGLAPWIDATAAATVIGVAKPAAAAYQAILARLGVAAGAAIFCDDEPHHVAGAQQVGLHAFLVDRQRTHANFAAGYITSLADIPPLIAWLHESRAG